MSNLLVTTACLWDNPEPVAKLEESCEYLGLDFSYYGIKTVFTNWKQAKVDLLIDHLINDNHDYVLFTDGFDSWMLKGEEDIMDNFNSFRKEIVISAEQNCYPLNQYIEQFPPTATSFRYPCAGQFMGEREALLKALTLLKTRYMNMDFGGEGTAHKHNDQTLWQAAYLENRLSLALDDTCRLFLSAGSLKIEDFSMTNGELKINEPNTYAPCSVHFNGPKGGSTPEVNMNLIYDIYKGCRV